MRLTLIILALVITACNKSENHIPPRPYTVENKVEVPVIEKKEEPKPVEQKPVEQKPVKEVSAPAPLIIAHAQGQSILREKLMQKLINEHLEKKSIKNEIVSITPEEEFTLKNKAQGLTNIERGEYLEKSKKQARVVLSYSDQVMVFFVDPGLKLKSLREFLTLKEEPQKTLMMLGAKEGETFAGKAVYFLSADKKEILNYDLSVYSETFHYGRFSESLNLRLNRNQKAEAFIAYEYYVQALETKDFSQTVRCSRERDCHCKWSRPIPTEKMVKESATSIESLGMQVRVNDVGLSVPEWKLVVTADNMILKMPLSAPIDSQQSSYIVHFSFAEMIVKKSTVVSAVNSVQCVGMPITFYQPIIETLKTKTYATLKLVVWGHGDLLNDLKLE